MSPLHRVLPLLGWIGLAAPGCLLDRGALAPDAQVVMPADACVPSAELCNGRDDDCDPSTADGSADPEVGVACDGPDSDSCEDDVTSCLDGAVVCATGDDTVERCGGGDEDCDGLIDESEAVDASDWFTDGDGDGHGAGLGTRSCMPPPGRVASSDDCDDGNPAIHPGAIELCNGVDDDCSGMPDEDVCGCPVRVRESTPYLFCSAGVHWSAAELGCRTGGPYRIVAVEDAIENEWLATEAQAVRPGLWWLGLLKGGSSWNWAGGGAATYENWATGEGAGTGGAGCGAIDSRSGAELGGWRDESCALAIPYICELSGP